MLMQPLYPDEIYRLQTSRPACTYQPRKLLLLLCVVTVVKRASSRARNLFCTESEAEIEYRIGGKALARIEMSST